MPPFAGREQAAQLDQDEAAREFGREFDQGLVEDGELASL